MKLCVDILQPLNVDTVAVCSCEGDRERRYIHRQADNRNNPNDYTNYFRLPNDIFNLDLCAEEIAVYAFILRMENRRIYTCFPSYKTKITVLGHTCGEPTWEWSDLTSLL